jgi:hypothetical protein
MIVFPVHGTDESQHLQAVLNTESSGTALSLRVFCRRFSSVAFHKRHQVIAAGSQGKLFRCPSPGSLPPATTTKLFEIRPMFEQASNNVEREALIVGSALDSEIQGFVAMEVLCLH